MGKIFVGAMQVLVFINSFLTISLVVQAANPLNMSLAVTVLRGLTTSSTGGSGSGVGGLGAAFSGKRVLAFDFFRFFLTGVLDGVGVDWDAAAGEEITGTDSGAFDGVDGISLAVAFAP